MKHSILISQLQVVSLPLQSVMEEVANFCAATDTLIDQDESTLQHLFPVTKPVPHHTCMYCHLCYFVIINIQMIVDMFVD